MIRAVAFRIAGYGLGSILASAFYIGWIIVQSGPGSLRDRLVAASILYLFGGFAVAVALMTLPWVLTACIAHKAQTWGALRYVLSGSMWMLVMGCVVSAIAPKPLFVEDQTFWGGVTVTLERQGICFALSGAILGFGYWFLAERPCYKSIPADRK